MGTNRDHVPVIVIGSGYTALGALRSLAQARIPVYIACPPNDLATRSRWFRPTPGQSPWSGTLDTNCLESLAAIPLSEAALIAGADDAALWLTDIATSPLGSRFRVSSSSRETLEILQDKSRFAEFLARTAIPHPRSFPVQSLADVASIPFDDLDRVFIKPADSQSFNNSLGKKGVWACNRAELESIWSRLDDAGFKMIVQEYVPGSSADHYFIDGFRDRHGEITGALARRRIRIFPPDFGNSSYCESIALAEVSTAHASLSELLALLAYRGIFSAEFKRDARTGEFKLLEVNTRAWWYVEFAARCGVNVCKMAYEDALDMPVTRASQHYPIGAGCTNLLNDIKSVRESWKDRASSRWNVLGQWSRTQFHVFRLTDPRPGIHLLFELVLATCMKALPAPCSRWFDHRTQR